jgi:hypothetical protein
MLNRVWAHPEDNNTWKTKVEEHVYRDGTFHYTFRDRFGRTFNIEDWNEAENLIKHYNLVDFTEKMVEAGWISRAQYEAFRKRRS